MEQEDMLVDYLKTVSKMCHGLTRQQARELAFEYAHAISICQRLTSKTASADWLKGFVQTQRFSY